MWQVRDFALIKVIHCANSRALHAYHGSDVYSYAYGLLCHWRSKDSDPKHRNIRDMEGTSTYSTMRVECIVFYVDPEVIRLSFFQLPFYGSHQH